MYMLPQILDISTENFIINQIISDLKNKLEKILNSFSIDTSKNRCANMFIEFQNIMNQVGSLFFSLLFENIDNTFKNSSLCCRI